MTLSSASPSPGAVVGAAAVVPAPPRTASLFACVTTLTNTLLGVSVVGVAGGFSRAGCAVGTLYLILFACLSGSGLHLLARSSMTVSTAATTTGVSKGLPPPSSFRSVALVGAPRWAFLIDVAVALKCFGVATSYLVVVGDLMPTVMSHILGDSHQESLWLGRHAWVTVGFLLAAPLAFSRTLGALKYTATLAIGLVIFLSGMVLSFLVLPGLNACPSSVETLSALDEKLGNASSDSTIPNGLVESLPFEPGGLGHAEEAGHCFEGDNLVGTVRSMLQTLPLFVFCFTCHQNIFTICNEIVKPTPARVDSVIVMAMIVALTTQLAIAWGAYATFGVGVEDDLLEAYPETGLLTAARVSVSILVTSCYPLQAHPSRLCILSTWKAFAGDMHQAYVGLVTSDDEEDEEGGAGAGAGREGADDRPCREATRPGRSRRRFPSTVSTSPSPPPRPPHDNGHGNSNGNSRGRGSDSSIRRRRRRGGVVSTARQSRSAAVGDEGGCNGEGEGISDPSGVAAAAAVSMAEEEEQLRQERGFVASGYRRGGDDAAGLRRPRAERGGEDLETQPEREDLLLLPGVEENDFDLGDSRRPPSPGFPSCADARRDVEDEGRAKLEGEAEKARVGEEGKGKEAFWTTPDGFRHVLVTAVFLGLSYAIAMTLDDLGVILEVVGATGSTTITFILPGLLYLKVHPDPHPKRSLAALQLAVGVLIIPVALTFIALGDSAERRR